VSGDGELRFIYLGGMVSRRCMLVGGWHRIASLTGRNMVSTVSLRTVTVSTPRDFVSFKGIYLDHST